MAKKTTKADAVPSYEPPKPSVYLEGKEAQRMQNLRVGQKVQMVVEARVTRQSIGKDFDGKTRHSAALEIDRMRPQAKASKAAPKKAAPPKAKAPSRPTGRKK